MKWTRKTEFGQFKPYISEDDKYMVADMSMSAGATLVPEYAELKKNNWKSSEDHIRFLKYCSDHKLSLNGANWVMVNNETGEIKFPFKSAKAAKEYAESFENNLTLIQPLTRVGGWREGQTPTKNLRRKTP